MRYLRILLAVLAFSLLAAAEAQALRLVEATKPDWRGENGLVFAADSGSFARPGTPYVPPPFRSPFQSKLPQ